MSSRRHSRAGAVVISDRYADATVAYQGYGQGMDVQTIRELNMLATGGVLPDLTLVLDLDPVAGMRRIRGRALDAFEKMDTAFHRRVREGYLEIARARQESRGRAGRRPRSGRAPRRRRPRGGRAAGAAWRRPWRLTRSAIRPRR